MYNKIEDLGNDQEQSMSSTINKLLGKHTHFYKWMMLKTNEKNSVHFRGLLLSGGTERGPQMMAKLAYKQATVTVGLAQDLSFYSWIKF